MLKERTKNNKSSVETIFICSSETSVSSSSSARSLLAVSGDRFAGILIDYILYACVFLFKKIVQLRYIYSDL